MSVNYFEVSNHYDLAGRQSPPVTRNGAHFEKVLHSVEGHRFSCDISNCITCLFSVLHEGLLIAFLDNSLFLLFSELLADNLLPQFKRLGQLVYIYSPFSFRDRSICNWSIDYFLLLCHLNSVFQCVAIHRLFLRAFQTFLLFAVFLNLAMVLFQFFLTVRV